MKKSDVKALVITGFGLNCEKETAAACKYAGATPEQVHLNELIYGRRKLDEFHLLTFIGGHFHIVVRSAHFFFIETHPFTH